MMPSAERAVAPYLRFQNIPKLFDFEAIAMEHPAPDKQGEAIGKYILQRMQDPKIAIVYEDSDYGALALEGLWRGLGFEKARSLVMNMSVDSAASDSAVARAVRPNSDVLVLLGGVSFQQRSLKHLANLTWHPTPLMTSASTSVPASLVPSGARTVTSRVVRRHLSSDESGEWNSFQSNLSMEDRSSDFALDGYLQAKGLVSLLESSTHDISSKDSNSSFRPEPLHHQVLDIFRFDGDRWVLDENT